MASGLRSTESTEALYGDYRRRKFMTLNKMIFLTLAVLVPGGLLILVLRSIFKSSFAERFLKGPQAVSG